MISCFVLFLLELGDERSGFLYCWWAMMVNGRRGWGALVTSTGYPFQGMSADESSFGKIEWSLHFFTFQISDARVWEITVAYIDNNNNEGIIHDFTREDEIGPF